MPITKSISFMSQNLVKFSSHSKKCLNRLSIAAEAFCRLIFRDKRRLGRHHKRMALLLSESEIQDRLSSVPGWRREGKTIVREFEFKDFLGAIDFVNRIAEAAEAAWHHPDIDVRWNKVRLSLSTHDQGGLTAKDFDLAGAFDLKATGQGR